MSSIVILFHANCIDGLFGALTFYLIYDKKAEYIPVQHGKPPPDVKGKDVFLVDFCYPAPILENMFRTAKTLYVLDHHLTAENDLQKIPDKCKFFDPNESGATLAWKYLFRDKAMPQIYNYVRARDLWLETLPDLDAFSLAIDMNIREDDLFKTFDDLREFFEIKNLQALIQIGKPMALYQKHLVSKAIDRMFFCPIRLDKPVNLSASGSIPIELEGSYPENLRTSTDKLEKNWTHLIVGYLNLPYLINESADAALKKYPFLDFCVCYYLDTANNATQFCLRSRDDRESVCWIAQKFGGGGQRNSSSFRVSSIISTLPCEHLNKLPLRCMLLKKSLKIPGDHLNGSPISEAQKILTSDYIELLRKKFPDQTLKIELTFDSKNNLNK